MPRSHRFITLTRALTCSLVLALAWPALAVADTARFEIKAEPLGTALKAFAQQAHMQLLYEYAIVRNVRGNPVIGVIEKHAALQKLLRGTGLEAAFISTDAATIRPISAQQKSGGESEAPAPKRRALPQNGKHAPHTASGVDKRDGGVDSSSVQDGNESNQTERPTLQDIIVTGTHIRDASVTSPLTLYSRQEIENGGFATTGDFIASIPQNLGTVTPYQTIGGTGLIGQPTNVSAGSGVNLHGLGPSSTLVLLDGQRMVSSPPGDFVDVSSIPVTALQRVDVITDGASAIYGTDAVGGVVNFILRRDYDGEELRALYGGADGGADQFRVDGTVGRTWTSGHALVTYDHFQETNLLAGARSYSASLPSPTDLIPSQNSNGAIVSIGQDIAPWLTTTFDGTLNERKVKRLGLSAYGLGNYYNSTSVSATPGLHWRLFDDWLADLTLSYGSSSASSGLFTSTTNIFPDRERLTMYDGNLNTNGSLFKLPGGNLRLALGAGFRYEHLTENPSINFDVTPRRVSSEYLELSIPVVSAINAIDAVRELTLDLAVRHEHYSDFGDTTNPKVGISWKPIDGLKIRSTIGTSFRAPTFSEDSGFGFSTLLFDFPNLSSPTGKTLALLNQGSTFGLGPERATTWTAGFDYFSDLTPGLNISGTYFNIHYKDRIGVPDSNPIDVLNQDQLFSAIINSHPTLAQINELLANPNFLNLYFNPFTPSDIKVIINNQYANLAETFQDGVDINVNYARGLPAGQIHLGLNGTYLFHDENTVVPGAPAQEKLNTPLNPVHLRLRANATWIVDQWTVAAFVNYTSGYRNNIVTPSQPIDAWTTVDLTVKYQVPDSAPRVLRGSGIIVSAQNIFDEHPPYVDFAIDPSNAGFDPSNANPLGRVVTVQLLKSW